MRFASRTIFLRRHETVLVFTSTVLLVIAFTVFLTIASETTVIADRSLHQYWRTTYDILVRSPEAVTDIERKFRLVEMNHLAGTSGGITVPQYELIKGIEGVDVAAPIAMLGYVNRHAPVIGIVDPLPAGVYRVSVSAAIWDGSRSIDATIQEPYYAFYYQGNEQIPYFDEELNRDFREELVRLQLVPSGEAEMWGFMIRTPSFEDKALLAAIDPEEEAKLINLDQMVVADDYLSMETSLTHDRRGYALVPVLLNIHDYVSETITIRIERVNVFNEDLPPVESLKIISGPDEIIQAPRQMVWEETVHVKREWTNVAPILEIANGQIESGPQTSRSREFTGYVYAPAPVQYDEMKTVPESLAGNSLVLEAFPIGSTSAEEHLELEELWAPDYRELMQRISWKRLPELIFRKLEPQQKVLFNVFIRGVYDVDPLIALAGASPNEVPLETYYPPLVKLVYDEEGIPYQTPATLRPTLNTRGYLVSPPDMLISLETSQDLIDEWCVDWKTVEGTPYPIVEPIDCQTVREDIISAVRVRVAGISELTPLAQSRIEQVAEDIVNLTGLHVDIMVGSSPQPVLVHIPGYEDVPGLGYVEEMWVKKGVNTLIRMGIDRLDRLLFGVFLIAFLMYLFNAMFVSILGRLPEFGVMQAIGWRKRTLIGYVMGEALVLGLGSGILSATCVLGIVQLFDLSVPREYIALLVPLGVGAFLLGALLPARRAVQPLPAPVIRSGEITVMGRGLVSSNLVRYIMRGVLRKPLRLLATLLGLTLAAASMVFLVLVLSELNGSLCGTLLGEWICTQIRAYHITLAIIAFLSATLAIGKMMAMNVMERRREIGLLGALGWRQGAISRTIAGESALIGLFGGIFGTAIAVLSYQLFSTLALVDIHTWMLVLGSGIVPPTLAATIVTVFMTRRSVQISPGIALRGMGRVRLIKSSRRLFEWLGFAVLISVVLLIVSSLVYGSPPEADHTSVSAQLTSTPEGSVQDTSTPIYTPAQTPTAISTDDLNHYQIDLKADIEARRIDGQERIEFVNRTGGVLDTLALRLYANYPRLASEGAQQVEYLRVTAFSIDGQRVTNLSLTASNTAVIATLDDGLNPGEHATLDISFELDVREVAGAPSNVWILHSFFPILAVSDETDWRLDVCPYCTDFVYSESALYEFSVTVPSDWIIAATGEQGYAIEDNDGFTMHSYSSQTVRDLALAMSPSFQVTRKQIDDVAVSLYSLTDDSKDAKILDTAVESLSFYSDLFGAYPYKSLDLVVLPGMGAAGVEYPGLIYLFSSQDDNRLPILVAHEVSHQWWYSAVGNDVFMEPWLDEALAQYSALVFLEEVEGKEVLQSYISDYEEEINRLEVLHGVGFPVGSSVWEFAPEGIYYYEIIYYKGAMFLNALRLEIGDEAFFDGWHTFFTQHQYGIATGAGFIEAMQQASGRDLRDFVEDWIGPLGMNGG